jgi:glycosyltransferase involved in cell wall biosynthesis
VRVAAVIPAYDEAPTVARVVAECAAAGLEPIVVDDGSRDATGALAAAAGATVLRHAENRGKGAALATGFRAALERGADAAVVVDADGQHVPSEAAALAGLAAREGADLVIGTRMRRRRGMPFVRWATNAMMSILLSMISGTRLSDTQCGMKAISRRLLASLFAGGPGDAAAAAGRFDIESEIILRASRAGFRVREAPVSTIYIAGRRSRIRPLPDTLRFLALVARHVLTPGVRRQAPGFRAREKLPGRSIPK